MLVAALASAFLGMSPTAQSAVLNPGRPAIDNLVQPAACEGYRRNYRSFSHCWRVLGRLSPRNAAYCSRICQSSRR
jgi:hypothetical protein